MPKLLSKKSTQMAGLLMWRAGLLLAGGAGLYRTSKFLMQFIDLPMQLEVGISLILCGAVVFMVALIAERFLDMRSEGNLTES